jgi:hypothetical protein
MLGRSEQRDGIFKAKISKAGNSTFFFSEFVLGRLSSRDKRIHDDFVYK